MYKKIATGIGYGVMVLFTVAILLGALQGFIAWSYINQTVYTDPQGNTITRGKVLELVGDNALQAILSNAEKAQAAAASTPPATPEVKK